ncbi:hypothetical protein T265_01167 [Opisthorchis viverrini]|uniref:Low-density lipoprotein receptor domain class A n=1 Tax=Opisthorchis viverrini TaxID=6198 RepID=A0A075A0J3_OPIVI|nr:hypothetical protein T265_01167 [Opisthorchis viverrini]KER32881.1 hypothetical protein T265_01167 [Opisthorchis viverrini]
MRQFFFGVHRFAAYAFSLFIQYGKRLVFHKLLNFWPVDTQDCFGLPENPITLAGAFVANSRLPGRTTCYFAPSESGQYLSMRFSSLLLPRKANSCPTLTINEYSSVREELIDDTDPNLRVPMVVPADPKQLFRSDCTNYEKMLEQVVRTSAPGLRIEMIFEPMNSDLTDVSYALIITSFLIGPSFNCPSGTFRCWSDRSRCIPESLTCDGIDNCFDDSDENNYLCTGRINGIPIPLFAIIIVVSFLGLVLIVTTVVFVLRKHRTKVREEEQTWVDMTIRPTGATQQPLLSEKNMNK